MTLFYFLLMMIPIVIIHELGHYGVGRLSKIRPEAFSVGFGPEIFSRTDGLGTKWRIAALPLGGYVRFAQDANGTSFPSVEPEKPPYLASFHGKIATILAGPFANFIFSFILFLLYASFHGLQSDQPVIEKLHYESALEAGDIISAVEGKNISTMSEFYELADENGEKLNLTILRGGEEENITAPNPYLAVVSGVLPGDAADFAGIKEGDRIIRYGEAEIVKAADLTGAIKVAGNSPAKITILRGKEELIFDIIPQVKSDGTPKIGVFLGSLYQSAPERLGLGDAAKYAFGATNWVLVMSYQGIGDLIKGDVSIEAMSGPVGMAGMAEDAAGRGFWDFIVFMAIVSSGIGFLNLLPIPILDGGHIILISYEKFFGRLPPQIVINALFILGISLLLGVLMITTTNEIFG